MSGHKAVDLTKHATDRPKTGLGSFSIFASNVGASSDGYITVPVGFTGERVIGQAHMTRSEALNLARALLDYVRI